MGTFLGKAVTMVTFTLTSSVAWGCMSTLMELALKDSGWTTPIVMETGPYTLPIRKQELRFHSV